MSIVANVVCTSGSWVVYDGRATRDGSIVSENQEKAKLINPDVCLGYTGILEVGELVAYNLQKHVVGSSTMKSDTIAEAIVQMIPQMSIPDDKYANFLVTGINSSGDMATYTFGTSKLCINAQIPQGSQIMHSFIGVETNHSLQKCIEKEVLKNGLGNVSFINAMIHFIKEVAQSDKYVNTHCRSIELRKG